MTTAFYSGQKVVVTGGAGMVGSALVEMLVDLGADVLVADDMSRGKTHVPGSRLLRIDAGDGNAMRNVLHDAFALFNLAAYVAGVQYNQHNHALMFERNARLQTAPIIAASVIGVPHVLQTSSVCVYAPTLNAPGVEANGHMGEPHPANNGYSWSKRIGERAAQWSSLPHSVIVRPSNIYGPRDYFDERAHVIPALIRKAVHDDVIRVNGSGYERREFIYVDDVARGMLTALEKGAHGQVYNIGTSGETCVTIRELVALIQAATWTDKKTVEYAQDYDPGDPARYSDASALMALGWKPAVSLADGIHRTADWYEDSH